MQVPDLSRFNEEYRRAPAEVQQRAQQGWKPMTRFVAPDGKYQVMVESVELTTAKSSGNPLLKWRLRITSGPHENKLLYKNRAITPNTIEWVKKELQICGLDLEPFSNLPGRLRELANVELAVSKVTHGEHDNIYVNKRLNQVSARPTGASWETDPEPESGELSDDLPF
jgi:hypothetical protein